MAALRRVYCSTVAGRFPGTRAYWEQRYSRDGNSGLGSQGRSASAEWPQPTQHPREPIARQRVCELARLGGARDARSANQPVAAFKLRLTDKFACVA